jgi:hypothetical protein
MYVFFSGERAIFAAEEMEKLFALPPGSIFSLVVKVKRELFALPPTGSVFSLEMMEKNISS